MQHIQTPLETIKAQIIDNEETLLGIKFASNISSVLAVCFVVECYQEKQQTQFNTGTVA